MNKLYGGNFVWTGYVYEVHVHGGRSPLQSISRMLSPYVLDQLVFHEDGTMRRSNLKMVRAAGFQLHWRWEPLSRCILIEFCWRGRPLRRRWEQLDPVGDPHRLGSGWVGTAHVRNSTYTYSLKLKDKHHLQQRHQCMNNDSLCCYHGSILDGQDCLGTMASILLKLNQLAEQDRMSVHHILQIVDRMYIQELVLQAAGELADVVMETALAVEQGSDPEKTVTLAQDEFAKVRTLVFESFQVRINARGGVAVNGGVQELQRILTQEFEQLEQQVLALISKLSNPASAIKVKLDVGKRMGRLTAEYESIAALKEANSNLVADLSDGLDHLQDSEFAFRQSVMRVATSNPECSVLQKVADSLRAPVPA